MTDPAANHVTLAGVPSGVGYARGAAASGLVTVTVSGTDTVMHAARGVTFAANDRVAFIRVGQIWVALCTLGTAAAAEIPDTPTPPPSKPPVVTGSKTFLPVETRSRQGSRWRTDNDDVYQGQYGGNGNHTGPGPRP
jgi:hypothetical protein